MPPQRPFLLDQDRHIAEKPANVLDAGLLFGRGHGDTHGCDIVEPELRDAVDAMQPVASRSRQPRDDVVLPVGPHGLDAQSQRTMHLTPVPRKGSEIDAVAIADEAAANDHWSCSSEICERPM